MDSTPLAILLDKLSHVRCSGYDQLPILTLFSVAPTLEHRSSVKRFISLQFLNLTDSR
jgi:hypothetical protein